MIDGLMGPLPLVVVYSCDMDCVGAPAAAPRRPARATSRRTRPPRLARLRSRFIAEGRWVCQPAASVSCPLFPSASCPPSSLLYWRSALLSLSLSLLLSATPRYPAFRLPSLLIGRSRFGDSSGHHNPSPRGCALVALGSRASSVTGAPSHLATCGHGPMRVSSPLTPSPPTDGPFLQPRSIGWE